MGPWAGIKPRTGLADEAGRPAANSDLYFDVYAGGQLELHEGVNGFGVAVLDVEKPAVRIELELLAGLLVDEGGAVYREDLLVGGKGNGTNGTCFPPSQTAARSPPRSFPRKACQSRQAR